jgi:hypothetical protein
MFCRLQRSCISSLSIFWCATWNAFTLVVVFGHTCGFNVISIMSLNTRFAKLMDGFTCIFEVFTDVCYVFSSKMMILGPIVDSIDANGAFKLLGVTFQWSRLIAWAYIDLRSLEHVHWGGGCIGHLNKIVKYRHVWVNITIIKWLCSLNHCIR